MNSTCTAAQSRVPDLLHRFTRTPLSFRFPIGKTLVMLETNDPRVLAVAASFRSIATLHPAIAADRDTRQFRWKLVRENYASTDAELSMLVTDDLFVLFRGDKSVISVDCKQREVSGFIAADVTDEELKSKLFPLLAKCCEGTHFDQQFRV